MIKVKAKIEWLIPKERIPDVLKKENRKTNEAYCPIIIFRNQYDVTNPIVNNKKIILWSAVIFNDTITEKESISSLSYLMDNAPHQLLKVGAEFELFEGKNKVAQGVIIDQFN